MVPACCKPGEPAHLHLFFPLDPKPWTLYFHLYPLLSRSLAPPTFCLNLPSASRNATQGDADAETMEEYIKKMLETSGESGMGCKADLEQLPSQRLNPEKSVKNPAESDELRKQRKEDQRMEYERMEALRKQKEQEKVRLL